MKQISKRRGWVSECRGWVSEGLQLTVDSWQSQSRKANEARVTNARQLDSEKLEEGIAFFANSY